MFFNQIKIKSNFINWAIDEKTIKIDKKFSNCLETKNIEDIE